MPPPVLLLLPACPRSPAEEPQSLLFPVPPVPLWSGWLLLFLCMYPACLCHTLTSGKCSQPGLRNQKYFLIRTASSYNCWLSFRTYSGYGVSSLHTAALHPLSHLQGHFAAVSVLPASHRNRSAVFPDCCEDRPTECSDLQDMFRIHLFLIPVPESFPGSAAGKTDSPAAVPSHRRSSPAW